MHKTALARLYRIVKSLRFHHLSGVLGVLLAVSAFLALGGFGNWGRFDDQPVVATIPRVEAAEAAVQRTQSDPVEVNELVYYLVRTPQQGDALLKAMHSLVDASGGSSARYVVLVEDTTETWPDLESPFEMLMLLATQELSMFDTAVTIVDLR